MSAIPIELPPPTATERRRRVSLKFDPVWNAWEECYPWVGGISVGWLCYHSASVDSAKFGHVLTDVLPLAISVAAIFAGLQGAMHAILLSMLKSRAARTLKQRHLWGRLIRYVRLGITSLVAFVALGMTIIVMRTVGHIFTAFEGITAALVGVFAFSIIASLRIMLLEIKMLSVPDDDESVL